MKPLLEVRELFKAYGDLPVLRDVTFGVKAGDSFAVLGPSGCGKTSLLYAIAGLLKPIAGGVTLDGEPLSGVGTRVALILQNAGLLPWKTVWQNANLSLLLAKEYPAKTATAALEEMGLTEVKDRYPTELSEGMKRRVGIARALATSPAVMLMDEPFGAIDPINRNILQNEFLRLQQEIKKTVLFVTHDIDEAIKIGDKICILNVGGHLEQFDSPANILAHPANEFVEDFVGADRALKRLNLVRVEEVMDSRPPLVQATQNVEEAVRFMRERNLRFVYVVDADRTLKGYVRVKDMEGKTGWVDEFVEPAATAIQMGTNLRDALSGMLVVDYANVCVVDAYNRVRGLVNTEMIHKAVIESESPSGEEGEG